MQLICSCCGGYAPAKKQWPNQDTGYGICARCFTRVVEHEKNVLGNEEALDYAIRCYGRAGEHHSLQAGKELHIFPSHNVEVGTGEPGYRWVQGYSQVSGPGVASQALTLSHWRAIAKRDGEKLIVHATEKEALAVFSMP
jgi:hypothetical protein